MENGQKDENNGKGGQWGKKKKEERKEDREEKLKWTRTFRFNKILLGMVLTRIRLANGNYDRIAMVKRRSVQQCGALKRVYNRTFFSLSLSSQNSVNLGSVNFD